MKKTFSYLVIILIPFLLVANENSSDLFTKGNNAYAEKNYDAAKEFYIQLLEQDYQSPELYYNLGNTCYQLNETGPAVLYYEKALKYAPDDEDIQFNLKMANLRVSDISAEPTNLLYLSGFKSMLVNFASDRWSVISLIFLWVAFVLFFTFLWLKKAFLKRLSFFTGLFALLLSFVFIIFSLQQLNYTTSKKSAIIMVTNTYVKSSPSEESTDLFILREGVKVKVMDKVDHWLKVKFSEEKVGWIEADKLGLI